MPILGINSEKCTNCQQCIPECPTKNFSIDENQNEVIFSNSRCILCGHCIAICPENAILYEDMKDIAVNFEELSDSNSHEALFKLIRSKRSVRQYQNKQVPHETIEKIVESIRYAPTAINLRTLKCIIISSKKKIGEFTDSIIDSIESEKDKVSLKKMREKGINPFFYNAPHILILHSKNGWGEINATIAITYAMLCAESLGLGSCWIGGIQKYLLENKEKAKDILDVVDNIVGIMIFGYPAVQYKRAPPRPPIETKVIGSLE